MNPVYEGRLHATLDPSRVPGAAQGCSKTQLEKSRVHYVRPGHIHPYTVQKTVLHVTSVRTRSVVRNDANHVQWEALV